MRSAIDAQPVDVRRAPPEADTATPRRIVAGSALSGVAEEFDSDAVILAAFVVAEVWRKGGFFSADVVVLPIAALALALATTTGRSLVRGSWWLCSAGLAVACWWVVSGVGHATGVTGYRLPAAGVALVAGMVATRALPPLSRQSLRMFLTWLGALVAAAGLVSLAVGSSWWILADQRSRRLSGSFTYPSATGLFLVLCLLASLRPGALGSRWWRAAQALMVMGVLATDSRGSVLALVGVLLVAASDQRRQLGPAIVAGVLGSPVLLIGQRAHGAGLLLGVGGGVALAVAVAAAVPPAGLALGRIRRWRWPAIGVLGCCVVAAGWLLGTQHRAVSGLDASWTERIRILHGAGTALSHHLWWGAGPDPLFVSRTMTGAPGIASFAHNEPLEIALSVGLVGLALVVGVVVLAVRSLHRSGNGDLRVVAVALLLAGLVDFVWHFPVLGLVAGIVLGSVPSAPSERFLP